MNRYTIYCTESQVRKAMALGAPISADTQEIKFAGINGLPFDVDRVVIPTTDQMIGWLEEQGFYFHINTIGCSIEIDFNCIYENHEISRKESTLAAIDAALDYLIKNKE